MEDRQCMCGFVRVEDRQCMCGFVRVLGWKTGSVYGDLLGC